MTIKSQGGIFGRNPTFNDVEVDGTLTVGGNSVPDASTILVDGDIGSTVQGYDADTAKTDAANIFTADQTISTSSTLTYFNIINTAGSGNRYSAISLKDSSTQNALFYQNHNDGNILLRNDTVGGGIGLYTQTATYGATLLADGNFSITDGNLQLASGKGIDFSATSGTGTSELFDDYEEGTFTVTMTPSTSGSITQHAAYITLSYTKIGRAVTITGNLVTTGISSAVGTSVNIGSLPFVNGNGTQTSQAAGTCFAYSQGGGVWGEAKVRLSEGSSTIDWFVDASTLTGTKELYINLTYFTS